MNTEDLYCLLRTGHVQAQGIVDTIAEPLLVLDADPCAQAVSRSFFGTFKVDRYGTIGKPVYDLGNGHWDIPELRRLLMDVIPNSAAVVDYRVEHDFPGLGRRTMLLTARTLFHPDNALHSLLLAIHDVTDRSRRDATREMQLAEVQHRMRNLLAVLHSIAAHTATKGRTAEEYRDDFLGRFNALVEAQDLGLGAEKQADLKSLLGRILSPYGTLESAVVIEPGPVVELSAKEIVVLSLALHELATNAAKHGALSRPDGQVRISWQIDDGGQVRLAWAESGGPPVRAPTKRGYGSKVIEEATTYSLGGEVKLDFARGGLQAEIAIPRGTGDRGAARRPGGSPSEAPSEASSSAVTAALG